MNIIEECDIIHIGLNDGDYPYIVPLNFGYHVEEGKISFYIHGAMAGRKYELLKRNGKCSFEMEKPLKMDLLYQEKDVTLGLILIGLNMVAFGLLVYFFISKGYTQIINTIFTKANSWKKGNK